MCVVAIYLFISSINQTKQTSNNFCIIHRSFSAALKLSKPTVIRDECSKSSETRKRNRKPRKMYKQTNKIGKHLKVNCFRDGRFQQGDELVNVAGSSLRGVSMEEARRLLRSCSGDVDIILARPATATNGDQTGDQLQYSQQAEKVPTRVISLLLTCAFTL